jgi:D-alanine--poly(phosphoribitol) ligase subunit 1
LPFFDWLRDAFAPGPEDRWAQFSRLGFDLSIVDILGALLSGSTLVPVVKPADRLLPGRFIDRERITIWHSVPSLIPAIVEQAPKHSHSLKSLRLASFCGEPLYEHHVAILFSRCADLRLFNTYGPTEGTLFCTFQEFTCQSYKTACHASAAIGRPIPGWQVLLAPNGSPAVDQTFEMIIAGDNIGAGYLGASAAEDARFTIMQTPIGPKPAFLTGDQVRVIESNWYFAGRLDSQVKIRGHRLELGEIEATLMQLGVTEAHAFVHQGRLIAAVRGIDQHNDVTLRQLTRQHLPDHAVPSQILLVDSFPRLSSGKVNYAELVTLLRGGDS